jgi:hypothetical protein
MIPDPQGQRHATEIAQRVQLLLIREAMRNGKSTKEVLTHGLLNVPSAGLLAEGVHLLLERQKAEARFALLMEIYSQKAWEEGRGLVLQRMVSDERKKIDECNRRLKEDETTDEH